MTETIFSVAQEVYLCSIELILAFKAVYIVTVDAKAKVPECATTTWNSGRHVSHFCFRWRLQTPPNAKEHLMQILACPRRCKKWTKKVS